jgi:RNA polymerase sigma-70 factor (ECF subfamily)
MRDLLRLVGGLPPAELDVLVLCAWEELTYEDAAAALGVPVGTVMSRLARGRERAVAALEVARG